MIPLHQIINKSSPQKSPPISHYIGVASGKRLDNKLENHHFIAGEINELSMAMFNFC